MKIINLHLISDSTGETLGSMSRAIMSQFAEVETKEFMWSLVRTKTRMLQIMEEVQKNKGIVLYTILNEELLETLVSEAKKHKIRIIPALDRIIDIFSKYIGQDVIHKTGRQYVLDEEYFDKINAINFTIDHDDGRKTESLEDADIVLVGPSRTSKSPTCIYLSYRGYKTANVPFISDITMPKELFELKTPLIIGLTVNPDILIQIRKNRMKFLDQKTSDDNDYVSFENVEKEVKEARRLYSKYAWPVIDVTRKSVEETSAAIIQIYNERKNRK